MGLTYRGARDCARWLRSILAVAIEHCPKHGTISTLLARPKGEPQRMQPRGLCVAAGEEAAERNTTALTVWIPLYPIPPLFVLSHACHARCADSHTDRTAHMRATLRCVVSLGRVRAVCR